MFSVLKMLNILAIQLFSQFLKPLNYTNGKLLRKGVWIHKDYHQVTDRVRITLLTVTQAVNKNSLARKGKLTPS